MSDRTVLYTDETIHAVEHIMKGNKQGCIHGYLDKGRTKPILISVPNISYATESELVVTGGGEAIQENVLLYSE